MEFGTAIALAVVLLAVLLMFRSQGNGGNRRNGALPRAEKTLELPKAASTKASKHLAKKIGLKSPARVTLSLDRVVAGGDVLNCSPAVWSFVEGLLPLGDVYLCVKADSDEQQERIVSTLEERGVAKQKSALPPHRVLFYSNDIGKAAIIRQLNPHLHIDGDLSTLQNIGRFLPKILHIGHAKPAEAYATSHPDWTTISSVDEIVQEFKQLDA